MEKVEATVTYGNEKFRRESKNQGEADWVVSYATHEARQIEISGPDLKFTRFSDYRLYGFWTKYNGRTQFKYQSGIRERPISREACVEYICKFSKSLGIGPARAGKMYDMWGSDCVAVAREHPDRVAELCGVTFEKTTQLAKLLIEHEGTEKCRMELSHLIKGYGMRSSVVDLAIARYGARAFDLCTHNPYLLMQFSGCAFLTADKMWMDLGKSPAALKRQALCGWSAILDPPMGVESGSIWFPEQFIHQQIAAKIGVADVRPEAAIALGLRLARKNPDAFGALAEVQMDGNTISEWGGVRYIGTARYASDEDELANLFADAEKERPRGGSDCVASLNVTDHQREQLHAALAGQIGVLCGGPGTGKTYTVARHVGRHIDRCGAGSVIVGAPTGKAAVRLTQAFRDAGVNIQAQTWHSTLRVQQIIDGRWTFEYGRGNPLPASLLISDETSMNDLPLMLAVMRARAKGTRMLLVGDVNQLPPVGVGAPFRDVLASGCPSGQLTTIMRNSGGIVEACDAIRQGRRWQPGDNLRLVEVNETEDYVAEIKRILERHSAEGLDVKWDTQVVTAMNSKSPLSREPLNAELTQFLNKEPGDGTGAWQFRKMDKVLCRRNQFLSAVTEDGRPAGNQYVANGDMGIVYSISQHYADVMLPIQDVIVRIPFTSRLDWVLGYAITVHSSQGSEWPVVIVILDKAGTRVCDRSWFYTAISRAKSCCYILGPRGIADRACRTQKSQERITLLRQKINLYRAEEMIAEL
jgi:exodeoxyribonuclease V alpha subunit